MMNMTERNYCAHESMLEVRNDFDLPIKHKVWVGGFGVGYMDETI